MINPRVVSIFVVAAVAAIFTLGVATSIFTIFPSGQQQAAAQQENTTTGTTTPSTANQTTASASNNKTFYLFNTELEGLDTATTGISHYIYSLPVIVANRGDSVTVHLFNIPETEKEEGGTEEGGTEEGGRRRRDRRRRDRRRRRHRGSRKTCIHNRYPAIQRKHRHCARRIGKCNIHS